MNTDDHVIVFSAIFSFISLLVAVTSPQFNANIIQFGVDQLQDSPADHQSLFIYWYVWIIYVKAFIAIGGSTITSIFANNAIIIVIAIQFAAPVSCSLVLLRLVLTIVQYKRKWLLVDIARTNPYKLVYRVISLHVNTKFLFVAVPLPTVRMTYPQGWIWVRVNMADPSLLKKWKM